MEPFANPEARELKVIEHTQPDILCFSSLWQIGLSCWFSVLLTNDGMLHSASVLSFVSLSTTGGLVALTLAWWLICSLLSSLQAIVAIVN